MYDLGSRLKKIRNERGLSQRALAERINKSAGTISSYETNIQVPPTEVLVSIAQALNVPLDFFVDINCGTTYSDSGLSPSQKEILELLFKEFTLPSNTGDSLSNQQIEIIRKLFLLFQRNK